MPGLLRSVLAWKDSHLGTQRRAWSHVGRRGREQRVELANGCVLTLGLSVPTLPQAACPLSAIPGAAPYPPRVPHSGWGPHVLPGEGREGLLLDFVPRESEISAPPSHQPLEGLVGASPLGHLLCPGCGGQDAVQKPCPSLWKGASFWGGTPHLPDWRRAARVLVPDSAVT